MWESFTLLDVDFSLTVELGILFSILLTSLRSKMNLSAQWELLTQRVCHNNKDTCANDNDRYKKDMNNDVKNTNGDEDTCNNNDHGRLTDTCTNANDTWPVSLVSVEGAGRGLRALRDLPGGQVRVRLGYIRLKTSCILFICQVVLEDWALVVGPSERSPPGDCSGCFLSPASGQCPRCWLGFCAEACKQVSEVARSENIIR